MFVLKRVLSESAIAFVLWQTGAVFTVVEAGFMDASSLVNNGMLEAGEVGYIAASIKSIGDTQVGVP